MKFRVITLAACAAATACLPAATWAQVTLKPDGEWRYLFSAGGNATKGNSDTTAINASGEAARVTEHDKLIARGQLNYGQANGSKSAQRYSLGTQYNRDISRNSFSFGAIDLIRDRPSNIGHRYSLAGGVGRHMLRGDENNLDISLGLGYTQDKYVTPTEVLDQVRSEYGRTELVMAEESSHRLTNTTRIRQKVTVYPNLTDRGAYRGALETGISVAMTPTLNLTAGLNYRYDSDPGVGIKKGDASFVTGVSLRFD
ncbi:YdiY family protein [Sphingomonas sp. NCPPB 2930]